MQFQNGQNMDKTMIKDFIHAQWGSKVGKENEMRITVLKEEVDVFK